MPLPEGVIAQLTPRDRYLVSFPRSGRTWINRSLRLTRLALESPEELNEAFIKKLIEDKNQRITNLNNAGDSWMNPLSDEDYQGNLVAHSWKGLHQDAMGPHLFLFRSPADVMVSYYHFATSLAYIDREKTTPSDFARGNLPFWIAHTKEAINRFERGRAGDAEWRFMSYETFLTAPSEKLKEISSCLGDAVPESIARKILAITTPDFMRKIGKSAPSLGAIPGRGATDLSGDILEEIEATAMPLYRQALEFERLSGG